MNTTLRTTIQAIVGSSALTASGLGFGWYANRIPRTHAQGFLAVESSEIRFGDVIEDTVKRVQVRIRNTSDRDLLIPSVSSSCGCTHPTFPSLLPAHGERLLSVRYEATSGSHEIGERITITPAAQGLRLTPLVLTVTGRVVPRQEIALPARTLGELVSGETARIAVPANLVGGRHPEEARVEGPASVRWTPDPAGGGTAELDIFEAVASRGTLVLLGGEGENAYALRVPFSFRRGRPITFSPAHIDFDRASSQSAKTVELSVRGPHASSLLVTSAPKGLEIRLRPLAPDRVRLLATWRDAPLKGLLQSQVVLTLAHAKRPSAVIPVYAVFSDPALDGPQKP